MIEPSEIKEIAKRYEDENIKFRMFLKNRADPDELDSHFAALHEELFADYDCCTCNNCCRQYDVCLTDDDTGRIAGYLNLSKDAFIENYLRESDEGYEIKPPCTFIERDGKCRIQECKPDECRGFPYTNQPDRIASLSGVIEFAETCPVVFEIVQRLKKIYRFKSR